MIFVRPRPIDILRPSPSIRLILHHLGFLARFSIPECDFYELYHSEPSQYASAMIIQSYDHRYILILTHTSSMGIPYFSPSCLQRFLLFYREWLRATIMVATTSLHAPSHSCQTDVGSALPGKESAISCPKIPKTGIKRASSPITISSLLAYTHWWLRNKQSTQLVPHAGVAS